ncbi:MAG: hypothetical protein A2V81_05135 [Candidatus Abawacabacteria bacterium RBG_16_42_10]|uniref:Uncharacterized protein n=1 Tax=Candidatus Abawacabacteria bacterium RBG_16_42_10 TaxID=1817814 RepID=A0A1F4XIQ4_9BACT|nr:MAG: hypothetical protein A2V81_05135 [Candidatus Abawacabacteria bacterium RBG_16_42_10]
MKNAFGEYDIDVSQEKNYSCQICGLQYEEQALAQKCQDWCTQHQSCSLTIAKHAVRKPKYKN